MEGRTGQIYDSKDEGDEGSGLPDGSLFQWPVGWVGGEGKVPAVEELWMVPLMRLKDVRSSRE